MQIGGGVRVGDAFQVISGVKPIAIWATEFCVEISQATCVSFASNRRNKRRPVERTESEADEWGHG